MALIPDWREVLRHAYSVRFMLISGVLSALAAALMFGEALPISAGWLFVLTFVVNLAAFIARFVSQKQLSGADE